MLLPSVAISIAINYLGKSLTLAPNQIVVSIVVLLPSTAMAIALWWKGRKSVES
jgi:hypothetical protein